MVKKRVRGLWKSSKWKKEGKKQEKIGTTASSGWFEDASKSLIIILIGLQFLITLSLSLSLSLEEEETISLI